MDAADAAPTLAVPTAEQCFVEAYLRLMAADSHRDNPQVLHELTVQADAFVWVGRAISELT